MAKMTHVALGQHVGAAELVDQAEGQPAEQRAGDAAQAAEHDHAEREHVVERRSRSARSRWWSTAARPTAPASAAPIPNVSA